MKTDGRTPSIWDTFSHTQGKTFQGETGDVAADSYHRYKEDIQLLKNLGATVYRFSISWSRVFPDGTGKVNEKGLDYYNRVDNWAAPSVKLAIGRTQGPAALSRSGQRAADGRRLRRPTTKTFRAAPVPSRVTIWLIGVLDHPIRDFARRLLLEFRLKPGPCPTLPNVNQLESSPVK